MITLDFVEQINAPVEKVFAYVTDFRKFAEWQEGVIESTQTPDGPTAMGTKFTAVRTLLGQRLEAGGEVTEFEPNKKCTFKTTSGPIKFNMMQTFEPAGGGTKMSIHIEAEVGGFFKLAEGAVSGNIKKQFEDQAVKLKQLLEA